MKKRAYNLPFPVNDLFLYRIAGKCHLSINKQYNLLYSSSHEEESKRPSSACRTKYKAFYDHCPGTGYAIGLLGMRKKLYCVHLVLHIH